jgi:hypothetical protein
VLSFNSVDHKRWVEDPEEFIRLLNDAKNTITDPRIAATEFIIDMMRVGHLPCPCRRCSEQSHARVF